MTNLNKDLSVSIMSVSPYTYCHTYSATPLLCAGEFSILAMIYIKSSFIFSYTSSNTNFLGVEFDFLIRILLIVSSVFSQTIASKLGFQIQ